MPADADIPVFSLVERDGPCARRVFRSKAAESVQLIVISQYQGPALPERLTRPEILGGVTGSGWRLSSAEGLLEFGARAVERIDCRASLYAPLHAQFALSVADRVAVRLLLHLLRLPGGSRLLRWWQSRR